MSRLYQTPKNQTGKTTAPEWEEVSSASLGFGSLCTRTRARTHTTHTAGATHQQEAGLLQVRECHGSLLWRVRKSHPRKPLWKQRAPLHFITPLGMVATQPHRTDNTPCSRMSLAHGPQKSASQPSSEGTNSSVLPAWHLPGRPSTTYFFI